MELDAIDFKILTTLQRDARASLKSLAGIAGVSVPTARFRVQRLKERGVIKRFVAVVDSARLVGGLSAFIMLKARLPDMEGVAKALRELEEVSDAYLTTGQFDLVVRVEVSDMKSFEYFVVGKLSRIPGIETYQSSFVVEALKEQYGPAPRPGFGVSLKCEHCGKPITAGLVRKQIGAREHLFCSENCANSFGSTGPPEATPGPDVNRILTDASP